VAGGVRVQTTQTERPVEASVNLREEHVNVERHRVDRPATAADLNQPGRNAAIEVTATSEVPVVAKEARVVEEVVVNKEATETVRDSVRKTDVKVEKLDADTTSRENNRTNQPGR
jgi:stress response protein YsnF